ncbi:HD domain-containing protein [Actinomadura adrarensis]|uniref:HD domain-containing protein n=1 Tax=Actinomadura adrarensis TaxID=1819600 RepID=A0ABW3CS43_9ACTN
MGGFLQLPTEIVGIGLTQSDIELIERAHAVASYWHRGQRRKSGVPYIQHPTAVATGAARMGVGVPGVCAALLHDVISGSDCPATELRGEFGRQISDLVEGLTWWETPGTYSTTALLVDEPVHRLKLADRLHNMQTIAHLPRHKRLLRCQETLEFFVPLAERLELKGTSRQLRQLALGVAAQGRPAAPPPALIYERAIVAVDIEDSTSRTDSIKARLRQVLYELLERALESSGLGEEERDPFLDRGDGALTLVHPTHPAVQARLLTDTVPTLGRLLARHNAQHPGHRFRLRVVVHAGHVHYDHRGCFGEALDLAFRLLEAPQLKEALRSATAPLVLVLSEDIYRCVVEGDHAGSNEHPYAPRVTTKINGRTHRGWVTDLTPLLA